MILSIKKLRVMILSSVLLASVISCEEQIEEVPFSELDPSVTKTEDGLQAILISAYGNMQLHRFPLIRWHYLEEGPSDLFLQRGGGQRRNSAFLENFTFDAQHPWIGQVYDFLWNPIRDTNLFLANVDQVEFTQTDKAVSIAEARFIRAFCYYYLTKWYGEVSLVTEESTELYPPNEPLESLHTFIEAELRAAADALPPTQDQYGRATKGAALAILTKFFLNTKQWQKCADVAKELMDLQLYALYPDYEAMFAPENERNSEFIFVFPQTRDVQGMGTEWMSLSLPPDYPIGPPNFAAQFKYYDAFVNTFDPNDQRRNLILTEYVQQDGTEVQLLGNNDSRSFKFSDPDRVAADQENDFPVVRYADILLSRAEALNELNGPTEENVGLINEVRARAGESLSQLVFTDYTRETLRDHILNERAWEFYSEIKRRSDLVRHGKFIEQAVERGKPAQAHHVLYPLPSQEVNANENLEQNDGY